MIHSDFRKFFPRLAWSIPFICTIHISCVGGRFSSLFLYGSEIDEITRWRDFVVKYELARPKSLKMFELYAFARILHRYCRFLLFEFFKLHPLNRIIKNFQTNLNTTAVFIVSRPHPIQITVVSQRKIHCS